VHGLEALNRETIFASVRAIDARDPYTARHSEKVAAYAVQLAHALGLKPAACDLEPLGSVC
jgi:HD-GYP domain-containing protein (c-di-GMP phosphodiesterase class II)